MRFTGTRVRVSRNSLFRCFHSEIYVHIFEQNDFSISTMSTTTKYDKLKSNEMQRMRRREQAKQNQKHKYKKDLNGPCIELAVTNRIFLYI